MGYMTQREVQRVRQKVKDALVFLKQFPRAGAYEDLLKAHKYRPRRWVVGNIKIIYHIDRDTILVTDIFDARQDPGKMKG
ncbi:MAG: hypothetical protein ABI599_10590 [Flavobacteriales bacterium]